MPLGLKVCVSTQLNKHFKSHYLPHCLDKVPNTSKQFKDLFLSSLRVQLVKARKVWQQGREVADHAVFSKGENGPWCSLSHFDSSQYPSHKIVELTYRVGLPPQLPQSRRSLTNMFPW